MAEIRKPLIAVVRGGYTGESVISMQSAACLMRAIDSNRFDPCFLTIGPKEWICTTPEGVPMDMDRGTFHVGAGADGRPMDGALIAIHGSPGEDGLLQGQLDMLGIPYQTGGVLNMAVTFSKSTTTSLLRSMGFPVAPSVILRKDMPDAFNRALEAGLPCFVKPDEAGSSLGISKVKSAQDMQAALDLAFSECDEVLVESAISGRELTCGVLTHRGQVKALPICEIRTSHEFFDYAAKYHASDTEEIIPAPVPPEVTQLVQERSIAIYKAMRCKGMVRVDHFWTGSELITIELNTVPGFSEASIFPKMLQASDLSVEEAVNTMLEHMVSP